MSRTASAVTPEQELGLHLMGTSAVRAARATRIVELAALADERTLIDSLGAQRVLALAGARLEELAPESVSSGLGEAVSEARSVARRGALLFENATRTAIRALADVGIPALPLKGVVLAERAHGDAGLRALPADVDILVARDQLEPALAALGSVGYGAPEDVAWEQGLPLLHYSLPPRAAWLPPLELHWRTHWRGEGFAADLLRNSVPDAAHGRVAAPEWELAAILLFYARDSFAGLRLLGDLTAWWDAHAEELPPDGLASVCAAHRELAPAIRSAALTAEHLGGIPAERVLGREPSPSRRESLAVRLADWPQSTGTMADAATNVALVELLLTPPRGFGAFLTRNMFQPAAVFAERYGSPEGAWLEPRVRRVVQGSARVVRYGTRFLRATWRAHRGRVPGRLPA